MQKIGANVTVNCVHPGVVRTRLTRDREGLLTGWFILIFLTELAYLFILNYNYY